MTANTTLESLFQDEKIATIISTDNHLELAKYVATNFCGFSEDDLARIDIFWNVAFNKSWLYVSDELIIEHLGYKKTKSTVSNFFNALKVKYTEGTDFNEVKQTSELVSQYYKYHPLSKVDGNRKKYYVISGETFKKISMRANTKKGDEICDYFIKVEKLCTISNQLIFKNIQQQLEAEKERISIQNRTIMEKFQKQSAQLEKEQRVFAEELQKERDISATSKRQAENTRRGISQIKQFIQNSKEREQDQRIYVAFCPHDALSNLFKIGGCSSAALLKKRLAVYNSGQSSDNEYAFAAIWPCHLFKQVEERIKQILGEFKQTTSKEVYIMNFKFLFSAIDFIINHYNEENEALNIYIKNLVSNLTDCEPMVPEPVRLNSVELIATINGDEIVRETINLNHMSEDEQREIIRETLEKFKKPNQLTVIRSDFETFMERQGITFKKRIAWSHLKNIVGKQLMLVY